MFTYTVDNLLALRHSRPTVAVRKVICMWSCGQSVSWSQVCKQSADHGRHLHIG